MEHLPPAFMEWVIEGRRAMYGLLEGKRDASFFGVPLPVVATHCPHEPIPFNTGNKGVGLLPVAGKIEHYCDLYQETLERCREVPWEESLPLRLEAVRCFVGGNDVSLRRGHLFHPVEVREKTPYPRKPR